MSKLEKIKLMLTEMLTEQVEVNCGSTTTDKGVIYWDEEELAEGLYVYGKDENGVVFKLEDGIYTIEDDEKITKLEVVDSIVKSMEVIEKVEEPTTEIPVEEEVIEEVEMAEEGPTVENPTNEGEETDTDAIVEIRKEINELYSIIDELKKEIEELKSKPVTMSVQQEFENLKKQDLKGASKYTQFLKK